MVGTIAAVIAALASFISNSEKILFAVQKYGSIALSRTAALGGSIETYMNYVALRKTEEIYDGQACATSAEAVSVDSDLVKNDLLVGIARKLGTDCSELSSRVSYSVYRFSGFGYEFIDDLSSYEWPGLTVENLGPFLVVQMTQTDFPNGMVMQVNGDRLEKILHFVSWTEASGGDDGSDEFADVQYTLVDGCLLLIAAGESKRHEICADGSRGYAANPISFDDRTVSATVENCEDSCSQYVEMLSRIMVPGHCVPQKNIVEWSGFPFTYRIELPEDSKLADTAEARGKFFCFPSSTLVVAAEKPDLL